MCMNKTICDGFFFLFFFSAMPACIFYCVQIAKHQTKGRSWRSLPPTLSPEMEGRIWYGGAVCSVCFGSTRYFLEKSDFFIGTYRGFLIWYELEKDADCISLLNFLFSLAVETYYTHS